MLTTMFKQPLAAKIRRGLKREARDQRERNHKTEVRRRDRYCRFPLCGCRRFKLPTHASHGKHKGMGGNPKEDRSRPEDMLLVCSARHQDNRVAIHRGTLKIQPLDGRDYGGPCKWIVDLRAMGDSPLYMIPKWFEVAREKARHEFEAFTPQQRAVLEELREMLS
jgi:hypothetical protein